MEEFKNIELKIEIGVKEFLNSKDDLGKTIKYIL